MPVSPLGIVSAPLFAPVLPKNLSHIFPKFIEAAAAVKLLSYSGRGRSCHTGASGEGRIDAIIITAPPWLGGGIFINISISTIIITITIFEIDLTPLIVCVELNLRYRFEASCMFAIGTLSLFCGKIIY
jgi:hypothetical protein